METKSSWSYVLKYGVIMGLISVLISVLFYFITPIDPENFESKPGGWIQSIISLVVMGIILFIGTKAYRDEQLDGYMSYGKSLGFACKVALPTAIIIAIYTLLFFEFIEPDLISKIAEKQFEKMAERGMSEEQMEQSMKWMAFFNTSFAYSLFSILGVFIQTLIVGLITSIFTQKQQTQVD